MFTGIVEHTGTIKTMDSKKNLLVLGIDLGPVGQKGKGGRQCICQRGLFDEHFKEKQNSPF